LHLVVEFKKIIKKGEVLNRNHITFKSPGGGLKASEVDSVLGKTANKDFTIDDMILMDNLID